MTWRTIFLSIAMLGGSFLAIGLLASVLAEVAAR
jgi:hypothetical protein